MQIETRDKALSLTSCAGCLVTNSCGGIGTLCAPATLSFDVDPCPADFNNDGSVDFFDYLDFVDAFSIGC